MITSTPLEILKTRTMHGLVFLLSIFCVIKPSQSQALNSFFTYEGLLTDSSGNPIATPQTVIFQIIYAPSCVVYEETQSVSPGTQGEFNVMIGTGTRTDTTANTSDRIFASQGSVNCQDSSTQAIAGFENRLLHVKVGATDLSPDITITNLPFAMNSQKLADKGPGDFVQTSTSVSQAVVESWFASSVMGEILGGIYNAPSASTATTAATAGNVTGIVAIANGGTGATTQNAAANAVLPAQASHAGKYLSTDGTNVTWAAISVTGTVTNVSSVNTDISVTSGTSTPVLTLNSGTGADQIVKLDASARLPIVDGGQLTNLQASQITSGVLGAAQGGTGQSAYSDGQILIGNSTTSGLNKATISAGTGVTIANGNGSITISATGSGGTVTNVTGTAPISVGTGSSTPAISLANGTVEGQVYRWNGTSSWVGVKLKYTDLVNSTGVTPWPAACSAGEAIVWNSATDAFICSSLSISTSQITGTLASTQMPALAGDVTSTSGSLTTSISAGAVTSAKIADGAVTAGKLGADVGVWSTNGTDVYRISGSVGIGTASPAYPLSVAGTIQSTSGGFLFPDGSVMTTAAAPGAGVTNAGDISIAADTDINGSGVVTFATNGLERMRVDNAGNVGIGTTSSNEKLAVNGNIKANGLKLGTTTRNYQNGGPASTANQIIVRSFVTTTYVDGTILFQTPDWKLERNGTSNQFRLVSLNGNSSSYWARSGSNYWSGDNTGSGLSVTFDPGASATEFQIFFGNPYNSDGKFAHIVINRFSTDYFWVGYVTTNHDN